MERDQRGLTADGDHAFTIRTLRREDGPRLAKIDAAITGRSRELWFVQRLERSLAETDVGVSVGAEKNDLLVGAVMSTVRFGEFGLLEPVAVLDTVIVDPAFGRQGVATALLEQLVDNLRALRVSTLRTEVAWDEVDLIAFFRKAGFSPAPRLVLEREV